MRAQQQPGVTYRVYLASSKAVPQDAAHYAGTINFFNVVTLSDAQSKPDVPVELDTTALWPQLSQGTYYLLLVPDGVPNAMAMAEIERIELIAK